MTVLASRGSLEHSRALYNFTRLSANEISDDTRRLLDFYWLEIFAISDLHRFAPLDHLHLFGVSYKFKLTILKRYLVCLRIEQILDFASNSRRQLLQRIVS